MFKAAVTVMLVGEHDYLTFLLDEVFYSEKEYADFMYTIKERTHYMVSEYKGKLRADTSFTRVTFEVEEF